MQKDIGLTRAGPSIVSSCISWSFNKAGLSDISDRAIKHKMESVT